LASGSFTAAISTVHGQFWLEIQMLSVSAEGRYCYAFPGLKAKTAILAIILLLYTNQLPTYQINFKTF